MNATLEKNLLRMARPTEMAELSLLLPSWQMQDLADAADARGMTVGQLLRGYIQQLLQPRDSREKNFDNSI